MQSGAHRRVAGATVLMMAGILLSRVLGLIRDRVIAHRFGQGIETDVYNAAFTVPDLLFFLIAGGALSSAFIPVFTEYIAHGQEREAWRIFSAVASVMLVVVGALVLLCELLAVPLVILTNPGYLAPLHTTHPDLSFLALTYQVSIGALPMPEKVVQTVALTRVLLPAQLCFFLGGLMMGTQTARGLFAGQAFGPCIYNLGIILGGLLLAPRLGVMGLCYGAVAGAFAGNLALQWYLVRRSGGYFVRGSLRRYLRHPGVRRVGALMLPVLLGLALPQVSTIVGKMFASALGDGPQSALMNANRLMQVPLGIFAQAAAIAIFPTMATQAARKELGALRASVNFGIRSILFLTLPSSLMMWALALPIVQLLLQSGAFTSVDARLTADVLRWFAIGIFAWSAHAIIARGFYALQDTRTPVLVGTAITLIFVPLNWPLMRWMGVNGLALATSIAATLHMLVMLLLLRRRLGGLDDSALGRSIGRSTFLSCLVATVCYGIYTGLDALLIERVPSVTGRSGLVLLACLVVGSTLYLGMAIALRMEEARLLLRALRRR
ncbi:MAG: murein biosynthesis integral membrane protein MurJ [Chloroherpetonaceae bacterium]|nr:murein biosynthesis integral membrane protein MurJ [Chthonomonadaceae bacterium]MDW8209062.1 murein biosynthesis integral membrane protein MurJ [Chloroherpetonaceae bacterium]